MFAEHDREYRHGHLSVTSLTVPCQRMPVLSLRVPPEEQSISFEGLIRTWEGIMLHKTKFLNGESELELEWEGIHGRVDEYSRAEAEVLEKKTTRSIPRENPRENHVRQVEYYSVLLERNQRPVKKASIVYIDPDSCRVVHYPVELRAFDEIEAEMLEKKKRVLECAETGILPPRNVVPWEEGGKKIVCQYCRYFARCFREGAIIGEKIYRGA